MAKEQDKESEKQALLREVENHKKQMLRWAGQRVPMSRDPELPHSGCRFGNAVADMMLLCSTPRVDQDGKGRSPFFFALLFCLHSCGLTL